MKTFLPLHKRIRAEPAWSIERVKLTAIDFAKSHGNVTPSLLVEHGRGDLLNAIKGKGGFRKLRTAGILPPFVGSLYWRRKLNAFAAEHGSISLKLLREKGRTDLLTAINALGGLEEARKQICLPRHREGVGPMLVSVDAVKALLAQRPHPPALTRELKRALNDREVRLLQEYYGPEGKNMRDIGREMQITGSWAQRLIHLSLRRLAANEKVKALVEASNQV